MASAPVIVAAAANRARRKVVAHFLVQHAISRDDAVAYVPQKRLEAKQFDRMRRKGIVHDAGHGTYWLDLPAYNVDHARTHLRLRIALGLGAVAIAGILVLFYGR